MHCSDEELLRRLDGELPALRNVRVRRHLHSCWRCRARLEAFEQEIHRFAVNMDEWRFPPSEWSGPAKERLRARIREFEAEAAPRAPGWRRIPVPVWGVAVAIVMLLVVWRPGVQRAPAPLRVTDVIAHAANTETTVYSQPVHQDFSVRITQSRPQPKTIDSRLQVWSDRDTGRFASRLSGPRGELKQALWRPAADREFVYRSASERKVVERGGHRTDPGSLDSLAANGLDPAEIESAFIRWMESRSWSAISLTADMSRWAAEDGTTATAERLRARDGAAVIRITARRRSRTMVAVLSVDVDSASYQPRLETIRFETPQRAVEFRLTADSVQEVRRSELSQAIFQPDPDLGGGRLAAATNVPEPGVPPAAAPAKPRLPPLDAREVQARYALHQAGACLGEPVRVSDGGDGVQIVRVAGGAAFTTSAGLDFVLKALADLRREQPPTTTDGALATATRHAWALRHLALLFESYQTPDRSDVSWPLLSAMVRDHREAVERALTDAGVPAVTIRTRQSASGDWKQSASSLFGGMMQLNQHGIDGVKTQPAATAIQLVYTSLAQLRDAFREP